MLGIVLLGHSNSGKSSIGRAVAEKLGMEYISSGDIARGMSEEIRDILNRGELAPENIMRERIMEKISSVETDFILDGFPRFLDQYEWLNQVTGRETEFIYVHIKVSHEDVINRALFRGRDDDNAIRDKINWFETHTMPMINEITRNNTIYDIENGRYDNIHVSINKLCEIVEEHRC